MICDDLNLKKSTIFAKDQDGVVDINLENYNNLVLLHEKRQKNTKILIWTVNLFIGILQVLVFVYNTVTDNFLVNLSCYTFFILFNVVIMLVSLHRMKKLIQGMPAVFQDLRKFLLHALNYLFLGISSIIYLLSKILYLEASNGDKDLDTSADPD